MDIARYRLHAQSIEGKKFDTPLEAVKHMGALQAQDFGQAVWAVGLRTATPSLRAVEQAIASREIVLTWPMRGTIHFVPAEDAKWMVELMASRMLAASRYNQRSLNVTEEIIAQAGRTFKKQLSGGKQATRSAMMQGLASTGIDTSGQRGYHLLRHFSLTGLICLASAEGKQQTFALMDEWVKSSKQLSKEEALAELTKRYFISHGPASLRDFVNWTGLTTTDAKQGLEAIKPHLISEIIDGTQFWFSPNITVKASSHIHLLPGFDEYFLGYKDRQHIIRAEDATKVVPGGNGVFKPLIVQNGQVVGTWKRQVKKQGVKISYDFFNDPIVEAKLNSQAKAYALFLGLPLL